MRSGRTDATVLGLTPAAIGFERFCGLWESQGLSNFCWGWLGAQPPIDSALKGKPFVEGEIRSQG